MRVGAPATREKASSAPRHERNEMNENPLYRARKAEQRGMNEEAVESVARVPSQRIFRITLLRLSFKNKQRFVETRDTTQCLLNKAR